MSPTPLEIMQGFIGGEVAVFLLVATVVMVRALSALEDIARRDR